MGQPWLLVLPSGSAAWGWTWLAQWSQLAAAFAAVLLAVWLAKLQWRRIDRSLPHGAAISALLACAVWSLVSSAFPAQALPVQLAETARNLALLWLIYRHFAPSAGTGWIRPVLPLVGALELTEILQPAVQLARANLAADGASRIFVVMVMFRLLFATGALLLVHNLYVGAGPARRLALRWNCTALAVLFAYDLNLFTIAYLTGNVPVELAAPRGVVQLAFVGLLAVGAARGRSAQRFSPSRAVAFQSLSLLGVGAYLVIMVSVAQSLALFGGNIALLTQLGFALLTTVLCLAIMPGGRLRGWLKVCIAKHFFQHRYDYRAEWLRFTGTIGRAGAGAAPLQERVVQAMADITDSPAGLLLVPTDSSGAGLAARWQWGTIEVPARALSDEAIAFFERTDFLVDLDELRRGETHRDEATVMPDWLIADDRAWVVVPLIHYERLTGVVVLARPAIARRLDWEDFDLLKLVARQLASYLAEYAVQEALLDASRFDEFNRRMAFVMHDIKNLTSQLSLLSRNAERHAENAAFRADMLVTLRNAADKLGTLLARLSRYGAGSSATLAPVDPAAVVRRVVAQFTGRGRHQVYFAPGADARTIMAHEETLEQALLHLVQNAIDASEAAMPVVLQVGNDERDGWIEVVDSGCGMSADFVQHRLFKPFVSSKPGGFGIGAFEARELVRAMHGQLDVESREGLGSRFMVRFPLAATLSAQTKQGVDESFGNKEVA